MVHPPPPRHNSELTVLRFFAESHSVTIFDYYFLVQRKPLRLYDGNSLMVVVCSIAFSLSLSLSHCLLIADI